MLCKESSLDLKNLEGLITLLLSSFDKKAAHQLKVEFGIMKFLKPNIIIKSSRYDLVFIDTKKKDLSIWKNIPKEKQSKFNINVFLFLG
jgi:hypothetical protein